MYIYIYIWPGVRSGTKQGGHLWRYHSIELWFSEKIVIIDSNNTYKFQFHITQCFVARAKKKDCLLSLVKIENIIFFKTLFRMLKRYRINVYSSIYNVSNFCFAITSGIKTTASGRFAHYYVFVRGLNCIIRYWS